MSRKRILILGAGLAGLSVAWHLQRRDIDCQIFEKESEIGGLCRSKFLSAFTFDHSGHLLHFRHAYVFNLIKKLLRNNLLEHQRNSWIYSQRRYTAYPFQVNLRGLPSPIIKECLRGFIEANHNGQRKKNKKLNFLGWINQTFGKGIARHFMIPYNNKFWTISPEKLTCEWVDGFIPVPSLNEMIEGATKGNQRQFGYNARFWYPERGGISQIPLALASQIKNIHTNCQVSEIDLDKKQIKMSSGNKERFDCLISTIPLPEMPHLVKGMTKQMRSLFKKLRWNSIFNLNLGIDLKDSHRRHWIYFPEKEFCFFRVGFFHNFSSYLVPSNKGSLYVEVSYSKDKPIDKSKIILRVQEDLKKAGLIGQGAKIYAQDINDIKYSYPIYDNNYRPVRESILRFLSQNNILSCGRYGSWQYMSMEDAILNGRDAAKGI